MERIISDAHTHVEPEPSSTMPVSGPVPLNVRWGRTTMAAVGLLALLSAGISGVLNVFNIGSSAFSWAGLVIFLAVVAGLRTLAIRDQNARRAAARAAAGHSTAHAASAVSAGPAVVLRETVLFDRAEGAEPAPVQKPLTAAELRNAAMRVAAKGTADAKLAHTQTLAEGELDAETWEPVEVPKPGYVTAARAAAEQAAPLEVPGAPKSAGTSIKADQAGIGVAGTVDVAPDAVEGASVDGDVTEDAPAAGASMAVKLAKTGHALDNLDIVLQRRRA